MQDGSGPILHVRQGGQCAAKVWDGHLAHPGLRRLQAHPDSIEFSCQNGAGTRPNLCDQCIEPLPQSGFLSRVEIVPRSALQSHDHRVVSDEVRPRSGRDQPSVGLVGTQRTQLIRTVDSSARERLVAAWTQIANARYGIGTGHGGMLRDRASLVADQIQQIVGCLGKGTA